MSSNSALLHATQITTHIDVLRNMKIPFIESKSHIVLARILMNEQEIDTECLLRKYREYRNYYKLRSKLPKDAAYLICGYLYRHGTTEITVSQYFNTMQQIRKISGMSKEQSYIVTLIFLTSNHSLTVEEFIKRLIYIHDKMKEDAFNQSSHYIIIMSGILAQMTLYSPFELVNMYEYYLNKYTTLHYTSNSGLCILATFSTLLTEERNPHFAKRVHYFIRHLNRIGLLIEKEHYASVIFLTFMDMHQNLDYLFNTLNYFEDKKVFFMKSSLRTQIALSMYTNYGVEQYRGTNHYISMLIDQISLNEQIMLIARVLD